MRGFAFIAVHFLGFGWGHMKLVTLFFFFGTLLEAQSLYEQARDAFEAASPLAFDDAFLLNGVVRPGVCVLRNRWTSGEVKEFGPDTTEMAFETVNDVVKGKVITFSLSYKKFNMVSTPDVFVPGQMELAADDPYRWIVPRIIKRGLDRLLIAFQYQATVEVVSRYICWSNDPLPEVRTPISIALVAAEKGLSDYCNTGCVADLYPHRCTAEKLIDGSPVKPPFSIDGGNECYAKRQLCRAATQRGIDPNELEYSCQPN